MELSSRIEVVFDLVNEVLKEVRDWRRELKELRLEIPIFEGHDVAGWIIKVEKYFNAGGACKEDQIPKVAQGMRAVEPSHGTNYGFRPIQVPLGEILKRLFSRNFGQKLI